MGIRQLRCCACYGHLRVRTFDFGFLICGVAREGSFLRRRNFCRGTHGNLEQWGADKSGVLPSTGLFG